MFLSIDDGGEKYRKQTPVQQAHIRTENNLEERKVCHIWTSLKQLTLELGYKKEIKPMYQKCNSHFSNETQILFDYFPKYCTSLQVQFSGAWQVRRGSGDQI